MATLSKSQAQQELKTVESRAKELREIIAKTSGNITDKVKSFDDALKIYEEDHGAIPIALSDLFTYLGDDKNLIAARGFAKMDIIREVLNEGWVPDWDNNSEYKYYPWFSMSGVGLSFGGFDHSCATSDVGSRLVFKTRELAEYAGKQFIEIYSEFHKI